MAEESTALLTAPEVSRRLNVCRKTLSNWVRRGCPVLRKNPCIFDIDQVLAWRDQQRAYTWHGTARSGRPSR